MLTSTVVTFFAAMLAFINAGPQSLVDYKKQFDAIDYGLKVDIDGHSMSVVIAGEQHDQTIVFLPGMGFVAPYITYKGFSEPLSEYFKVVTIEPFGYGLSDNTEKERTVENIVSEIHTCLQKLGISRFYFMGHSIGGLYSLAYSEKYPKEVLGVIGIDNTPNNILEIIEPMTVTKQTENAISRLMARYHLWRFVSEEEKQKNIVLDPNYKYSEEDLKNYDIIYGYTCNSENVIDEDEHTKENMESLKDARFKCPVLMFVASQNCKMIPIWKQAHENMIANPNNSEVIELDGSHLLFIDQKNIILNKVKEWIK